MVGSVTQQAVKGIQEGLRSLERSAQDIASEAVREDGQGAGRAERLEASGVEPQTNESSQGSVPPSHEIESVAKALVDQHQAELYIKANAEVIRVYDKSLGSILDQYA